MNLAAASITTHTFPQSHTFTIPTGTTCISADFVPLAVSSHPLSITSQSQLWDDGSISTKIKPHAEFEGESTRQLERLLIRHDSYMAQAGIESQYKPIFKPSMQIMHILKKSGRGRPSKAMVNSLKPYLIAYIKPKDALSHLPMLDDIVTGAVQLDLVGNTRALNKEMMVGMLQHLDIISSDAVRAWMCCEKRHAQKVAMCLRIIINLGMRIIENWPKSIDEAEQWVN